MSEAEGQFHVTVTHASAWGCWRCGGSFEGQIPYQAEIFDLNKERIIAWCPVCDDCAVDRSNFDDFGILRRLVNGQPVHWRLRLKTFWRLLRGTTTR